MPDSPRPSTCPTCGWEPDPRFDWDIQQGCPDPFHSKDEAEVGEQERCPTCGSDDSAVRGSPEGYAFCPDPFHTPERPEGEDERCGKCDSPIDPVSKRSLYEFDVDVPMGELRAALATAEAHLREAVKRLEDQATDQQFVQDLAAAHKRAEAQLDQAREALERIEAGERHAGTIAREALASPPEGEKDG